MKKQHRIIAVILVFAIFGGAVVILAPVEKTSKPANTTEKLTTFVGTHGVVSVQAGIEVAPSSAEFPFLHSIDTIDYKSKASINTRDTVIEWGIETKRLPNSGIVWARYSKSGGKTVFAESSEFEAVYRPISERIVALHSFQNEGVLALIIERILMQMQPEDVEELLIWSVVLEEFALTKDGEDTQKRTKVIIANVAGKNAPFSPGDDFFERTKTRNDHARWLFSADGELISIGSASVIRPDVHRFSGSLGE